MATCKQFVLSDHVLLLHMTQNNTLLRSPLR